MLGNELITIFSATDYAGLAQNSASILTIRKNGDITPKTINTLTNQYLNEDKWFTNLEDIYNKLKSGLKNVKIISNADYEMKIKKKQATPPRKNRK